MALDQWAGDDFLTAGTNITLTKPDTVTGGTTIAAAGGGSGNNTVGETAAYRTPDGGDPADTADEDRSDVSVNQADGETLIGTVTVVVPTGQFVMIQAFTTSESAAQVTSQMLRIRKGTLAAGAMIAYCRLTGSEPDAGNPVTLLAVDQSPGASQQYVFSAQMQGLGTIVLDSPIMVAITFTPSGGNGENAAHYSPIAFQAYP